jgi:hypothetical protein
MQIVTRRIRVSEDGKSLSTDWELTSGEQKVAVKEYWFRR